MDEVESKRKANFDSKMKCSDANSLACELFHFKTIKDYTFSYSCN